MNIAVRPASVSEAAAIERLSADVQSIHAIALPVLFKGGIVASLPASQVRTLLASPSFRILIAELGGEPAGYVFAEIRRRAEDSYRFARDSIFLHHLSVQPTLQGKGIGRALMVAVRGIAEELGNLDVELDVWSFNDRARRFFARQGFVTFNERMWSRGNNEP